MRVGHVDQNLEVDVELEPLAALRADRVQRLVEVVRLARRRRPVERQDARRHDLGGIDPRIEGILARSKRLVPDPLMPRVHHRPELEARARRVLRR